MEPTSRPGAPPQRAADGDALRRGLRFTEEFHRGRSPVHHALARLVARFDESGIPYAIVGAMALNGHGYHRATIDIDVLVTQESLDRFRDEWLGRGYVHQLEGSRGVRDTEHGVPIDFLVTGGFPGDGKSKSIAFPDPADIAEDVDGIALARLETLIELKLASGLSAPDRLRDLADVLEIIRVRSLPCGLADGLDPSVRGKYRELWAAAQPCDGG
jgi:hypothetical protein